MTAPTSYMHRQADVHHRAEQLAADLPPLLVAAERVAATVSMGVHGRRRVGQGETFWQFRRYEFGDSTQLIDWRQSAKSQPVYVRETEWEAAQSIWLWRDGSPSMAYRSSAGVPAKRERAELLLLALASLLIRGGEHVALLGTGMTPASGRNMLLRLWSMIEAQVRRRETQLSLPAFERVPRYGRIVMIGDFLSPLDEVRRAISAFADHGVNGYLLQILDPAEETLPFSGRVLFDGMENEGDILIGRVETMRDAYRTELADHNEGVKALARSVGWTYAIHHTDRPPEAALLALYLGLSQRTGA
ncbi:MAG TPA: DUF58 domain-containing protein [Rhodospirillales bacterium]